MQAHASHAKHGQHERPKQLALNNWRGSSKPEVAMLPGNNLCVEAGSSEGKICFRPLKLKIFNILGIIGIMGNQSCLFHTCNLFMCAWYLAGVHAKTKRSYLARLCLSSWNSILARPAFVNFSIVSNLSTFVSFKFPEVVPFRMQHCLSGRGGRAVA